MLGNEELIPYINIGKDGKIHMKEDELDKSYDYIEGYITSVIKKEQLFAGSPQPVLKSIYQIESAYGKYKLSTSYYGALNLSLLNCLSSVDKLGKVKIRPYLSGEYIRASFYNNGEMLKWKYGEIPKTEMIEIKGQTIQDKSEKYNFIDKLHTEVLLLIENGERVPQNLNSQANGLGTNGRLVIDEQLDELEELDFTTDIDLGNDLDERLVIHPEAGKDSKPDIPY